MGKAVNVGVVGSAVPTGNQGADWGQPIVGVFGQTAIDPDFVEAQLRSVNQGKMGLELVQFGLNRWSYRRIALIKLGYFWISPNIRQVRR